MAIPFVPDRRARRAAPRRAKHLQPGWLQRLTTWLRHAAAARQQRRALDSLSQQQLRDIGLRREAGQYWPLP